MQTFLVAPFSEGLDREVEPWLLPQDAFVSMQNAFLRRGVLQKRPGYAELATGGEGGVAETQSRVVDAGGVGSYAELPVMGIFNYIDSNEDKRLCVLDTRNFNLYSTSNNRLEYVTHSSGTTYNGGDDDFWSATNYTVVNTSTSTRTPILVFTNNVDVPQYFDGTNTEDLNNAASFNYQEPPASLGGDLEAARLCFFYGDRLIFLNTKQDTYRYPNRCLYSPLFNSVAVGGNSIALDFSDKNAGVVDAATSDEILGADFLAGDLIVYFKETGPWALKVTTDRFFPFRWEKLGPKGVSRCDAPKSVSSYFGEVTGAGILGIISTDGNTVGRVDNKLPFFTRDDINPSKFQYCYAVESERYRQRWLAYPSITSQEDSPDKVLVNGVEDNTWFIYDLPIHCFGNYHDAAFDQSWDEFTKPWDSYGGKWDSYTEFEKSLSVIGGSYDGYVFKMDTEDNDGQTDITGISQANPAVVTVANHRLNTGDVVKIYNVSGMTEINELQSQVTVVNDTSFQLNEIDSSSFTAYTSGGFFEKAILFDVKTKPLNPWIKEGRKAALHWVDFRVDTSQLTTCNIEFFTDERKTPYTLPDQSNTSISVESSGTTSSSGDISFFLKEAPVLPGTVSISVGGTETITDNGYQTLSGDVVATGNINYKSGLIRIFGSVASSAVLSSYTEDNSTTTLIFKDETGREQNWYRVYVNSVARSHQVRIFQERVDERLRIHAIGFAMSPAGSIEGGN